MNVLVCSKVSIPAKDRTLPAWEYMRSLGHTVIVEGPNVPIEEPPDALISMGITVMEETFDLHSRFPDVPLYCYNWDCYEWVWTNPRPGEYNYRRYGELLCKAAEVWVPSECTGVRTYQWWGLSNYRVIKSACPWWEYDGEVEDEGYALCCLREIPDPWWGKFEECCEELRIPCICTRHERSYSEYQKAVANCRFLCAPLYELSTGGLSLMEGYYLGKPCLVSDSRWNGARDYLGSRAAYFRHGDVEDFKEQLVYMHDVGYRRMPADHKDYIMYNFSDKRMIDDMLDSMERYILQSKF